MQTRLGNLNIITSPLLGSRNDGNFTEGTSNPISVYGIPIQSGVRIPKTKRLPAKKSPVIMVFSMLPVGTIYNSNIVTFNVKTIIKVYWRCW